MYLRKIPVRAGGKKKVYLSISHNEWVPASEATEKMGFARPHSIVNLGLSERLDAASVNELLAVLRTMCNAQGPENTCGSACNLGAQLKSIQAFLRVLVRQESLAAKIADQQQLREYLRAEIRRVLSQQAQEQTATQNASTVSNRKSKHRAPSERQDGV